jgi:hypothetical protein
MQNLAATTLRGGAYTRPKVTIEVHRFCQTRRFT